MNLPIAILRGGSDGRCCPRDDLPAVLAPENHLKVSAPEDHPEV